VHLEQTVNQKLNSHPKLKKRIKRLYQRAMYTVSPKIKSEGKIHKISPDTERECFFGYYGISPWDTSGRYVVCLSAEKTWCDTAPNIPADILLIDTANKNSAEKIAATHAWNVQQGCMLQWLGPKFDSEIIYNDFRDGQYCAVILNVFSRQEHILPKPVYSVAADGSFALTLDFSRLHRLRPGYGYSNIEDRTQTQKLPGSACIWKIDLITGEVSTILNYTDFANFIPREEMKGAEHKVNHLMISPNGKRFLVLHRWLTGSRKYSRLITANIDGTDMYNLSDDDMVSHCFWKNNQEILAFENKKYESTGYYLMRDKSKKYEHLWPSLNNDGHPSYSPDGKWVVTDTYPNRNRIQKILVMNDNNIHVLAKVFAPFKYDNDTRCDLHPRWSRDGKKIAFDAVFEGRRGVYYVENTLAPSYKIIANNHYKKSDSPKVSVIIPCYNAAATIRYSLNSLENQTFHAFEVIIIDDGSTDNTYEIINEYRKHSKLSITLIRQDNQGVSAARNNGIINSRGLYITFLDSDDLYHPDFLSVLFREINDKNKDLVFCRYEFQNDYTDEFSKEPFYMAHEMTKYQVFDIYNRHRIEKVNFWNGIYRKSILDKENLLFPYNIKYGEDTEFFLKYAFFCEHGAVMIDAVLYKYIVRKNSASRKNDYGRISIIEAYKHCFEIWEQDANFDKSKGLYAIDRAIWAQAKDFAVKNKQHFFKLHDDYNVRNAMRDMACHSDEKAVKLSSKMYLVSPFFFEILVKLYAAKTK